MKTRQRDHLESGFLSWKRRGWRWPWYGGRRRGLQVQATERGAPQWAGSSAGRRMWSTGNWLMVDKRGKLLINLYRWVQMLKSKFWESLQDNVWLYLPKKLGKSSILGLSILGVSAFMTMPDVPHLPWNQLSPRIAPQHNIKTATVFFFVLLEHSGVLHSTHESRWSVISCPRDGLRSTSQTASATLMLMPGSDKLFKYTAATWDARSIGIIYTNAWELW